MVSVILLSGCSLLSRKSFDKKLGNNKEAAELAKAWQDKATKEGFPQKWHVELLPADAAKNEEEYRRSVSKVKVTAQLTGKSVTKWKRAIEQKKKLPNPYLSWPDQWLENTVKELIHVSKKNRESLHVYPRASVALTLTVNGKVGAIAEYDASTKKTSLEIHY
jgi:hypothetical protein